MKLPMNVLASAIGLALGLPLSPTHASMGGGVWTPAQWFLANEQGIWLDPSDFTRYMAFGPELVPNWDFGSTSTAHITRGVYSVDGAFVVTGGQLVYTRGAGDTGANATILIAVSGLEVGKSYYFNQGARSGTMADKRTYVGTSPNGSGGTTYITNTQTSGMFVATETTAYIGFFGNNAAVGETYITDNVSIREVPNISTATLFQDSAGTTPVTAVEQPVGLMLDKRLGAAPLANSFAGPGSFDSATGWSVGANYAITGGKLIGTAVASAGTTSYNGAVTVGKWYLVTVVVAAVTSGSVRIECGGAASPSYTAAGTYVFRALATNAFCVVQSMAAGSSFSIESIALQELPGNHASQPTTAARPVLSARKNLFIASEQFNLWTQQGISTVANDVVAPDGTLSADRIIESVGDGSGGGHGGRRSLSVISGQTYRISFYAKAATRSRVSSWCFGTFTDTTSRIFDLTTLEVMGSGTPTIESVGNGWFRCSYSITATSTGNGTAHIGCQDSGVTQAYIGDGVSGLYLWGAQAEDNSQATAYQRVNTATDYDTVGFPHYLRFDGVDDILYHTYSMASGGGISSLVAKLDSPVSATTGGFFVTGPYTLLRSGIFIDNHVDDKWGSYASAGGLTSNESARANTLVMVVETDPGDVTQRLYTDVSLCTTSNGGLYPGDNIDRRSLGGEGSTSGRFMAGAVYQAVAKDGVPTQAARNTLVEFLRNKASLESWNMPTGFTPATGIFAMPVAGMWLSADGLTKYADVKGPELINAGAVWTMPSVNDTQLTYNSASFNNSLGGNYQLGAVLSAMVGKYIEVSFTLNVDPTSTGLGMKTTAISPESPQIKTSGRYKFVGLRATASAAFYIYAGFVGTISNVSFRVLTSAPTLFQDSFGSLPITAVEQPDGLALDKRFGLVRGAELVPNPVFATDTYWGKSGVTISGGAANFSASANGSYIAGSNLLTSGKAYEVTWTIASMSVGGLRIHDGGSYGPTRTVPGTYKEIVRSAGPNFYVISTGASTTASVSSVSVREITGNHAAQSTSAARPTLSARKNLLTNTENLTALFTSSTGVTRTNVNGVDGSTGTALRVVQDSGTSAHQCAHGNVAAGVYSFYIFNSNWRYIGLALAGSLAPTGGVPVLDTVLGVIKGCDNTAVGGLTAGYVEVISPGVFFVTVVVRDASNLPANRINPHFVDPSYAGTEGVAFAISGGLTTFAGNGTGEFSIWHPQAEYGASKTPYQRVTTATDYDPEGFLHHWKFDGTDDGVATGTFLVNTLSANMDVFMLVRRDKTTPTILLNSGTARYLGLVGNGSTENSYSNSGAPMQRVNGVVIAGSPPLGSALANAMPPGQWVVYEANNVNMSAWTSLETNYPSYALGGGVAEYIVCPSLPPAKRRHIRQYLAAQAGIVIP